MGQWGFGKNGDLAGTVCLFTGEPGTGKTLAAEAVGFETGKPLKVTSRGLVPHPTSLCCRMTSPFPFWTEPEVASVHLAALIQL